MALPDDVDYSDKNVRVYTRGLRATVTALEAAGVDAQDMKNVFRQAGNIAQRKTEQLIPVRTGKLRSTVRMAILKNKASIRVGRATVPYAARIEFGAALTSQGKRAYEGLGKNRVKTGDITRRIPGHFFLREAIRQSRHQALTTIVKGLTDLFHKHNLGDPPITISGYIVRSNSKAYSTDSKYLS
jgi:hypothetical protein